MALSERGIKGLGISAEIETSLSVLNCRQKSWRIKGLGISAEIETIVRLFCIGQLDLV